MKEEKQDSHHSACGQLVICLKSVQGAGRLRASASEESHTCFTCFCPHAAVWEARALSEPSLRPQPAAPCRPGPAVQQAQADRRTKLPLKTQMFPACRGLARVFCRRIPPPPAGDPAVPCTLGDSAQSLLKASCLCLCSTTYVCSPQETTWGFH